MFWHKASSQEFHKLSCKARTRAPARWLVPIKRESVKWHGGVKRGHNSSKPHDIWRHSTHKVDGFPIEPSASGQGVHEGQPRQPHWVTTEIFSRSTGSQTASVVVNRKSFICPSSYLSSRPWVMPAEAKEECHLELIALVINLQFSFTKLSHMLYQFHSKKK